MREDAETMMWLVPSALLVGLGYMMNSTQQAAQMLSESIEGLAFLLSEFVNTIVAVFTALNRIRTTPPLPTTIWEIVLVSFTAIMLIASTLSAVVHERSRKTAIDPSFNRRR